MKTARLDVHCHPPVTPGFYKECQDQFLPAFTALAKRGITPTQAADVCVRESDAFVIRLSGGFND